VTEYIDLPDAELYDLAGDPGERQNRVDRDHRADPMKRALQVVMTQQTGAPRVALGNEAAARLRSLGYTDGSSCRTAAQAADDPKRLAALTERFNTALTSFDEGRSQEALSGFRIFCMSGSTSSPRTSAATGSPRPAEIHRQSTCSAPGSKRRATLPSSWPGSAARCALPVICAEPRRRSNALDAAATTTPTS
jgi:hypothetical protein